MARRVNLNINIESGNIAVVDCPAIRIAEMLEALAKRLRNGHGGGSIQDVNGNYVGYMDFEVD